ADRRPDPRQGRGGGARHPRPLVQALRRTAREAGALGGRQRRGAQYPPEGGHRRRQPVREPRLRGRGPPRGAPPAARAGSRLLDPEADQPRDRRAGGALMGQKVHPYGFRLGTLYGWKSNWFSERRYADQVQEDHQIRRFIKKKLYHAGISKVVIDRTADKVVLNIYTARPGILIGKRGAEVETLRKELSRFTDGEIFVNIREIRKAELDAQLVAENIALQLEGRVAFRRAMKKALTSTMKFGAKGIRLETSGRLGGAEMGRRERYLEGRVPLHTLRADIDFGLAEARTTYGVIGVKCWIFKGDVAEREARQRALADRVQDEVAR